MKRIVEYKLHAGRVPYFIEDGGYFKIDNKLIGITKDSDECYIPDTLVVLSGLELKARLDSKTHKDIEGKKLTKEQTDKMIDDWLKEKSKQTNIS